MHFDTILKTLFQSSGFLLLELLTNAPIREWINVEIPKAQMNKLDLVAWLADGRLFHPSWRQQVLSQRFAPLGGVTATNSAGAPATRTPRNAISFS